MKIGLDVGSTTLKCVVLDDDNKIIYKSYKRHFAQITESTIELLKQLQSEIKGAGDAVLSVSGSAGMGMAEACNIGFVQEVYATRLAVKSLIPDADVVIELGGEDAKILYLDGTMEVRMNGSCAGGTGAFIDQMATLLAVTPDDLNELSHGCEKIYTIASRCGVFAKSDIQPLINQGARKEDISASIFNAVVNQTIAGLAQGRPISGKVVYLGGPLTFMDGLRSAFDKSLKLTGICPDNSLYFVAMGAAFGSDIGKNTATLSESIERISGYRTEGKYLACPPLFTSQSEYDEFAARHAADKVEYASPESYKGKAYIGIDAGSTTVKAVVMNENRDILCSLYRPNSGNPVPIIREFLTDFYKKYPDIKIASSAVTGYGEEIVKNAFAVDFGLVETMAHFFAAKKFMPAVDFIIDIGGQDIKCFKIRNGAIDNIFLNEACSSGCGSFLQTFAGALGQDIAEFAKEGLLAKAPVDLGSRCTVFMNSSVKQAQKDGATIDNISAGLSISVVKNALYKVIRAASADSLGEHIVVQGGTFLNDAVLRAFEQEIGRNVVRPNIAGLMGAYGAAIYSMDCAKGESTLLDAEKLADFKHDVKVVTCGICENHCRLTVNTFDGGRKFIGGNRCERPTLKGGSSEHYDLYEYKLSLLNEYNTKPEKPRARIGLPMGLNMYEMLPFWHAFFTKLGFEVVVSPRSDRKLYISGQQTIPSDTVCFPAKLIHGHIEALLKSNVDAIFYPCMTYNFDEKLGDNHYNCPVVAYYPEVIGANVPDIADHKITFIRDYIGVHRPKDFAVKIYEILSKYFKGLDKTAVKAATEAAYAERDNFLIKVRTKGEEYIKIAREKKMPIIVLAGRPYHVDPEINHGIDRLVCECGAVVVTEDAVSHHVEKFKVAVLNQWTYHSRLYAAAKYIAGQDDMNLVQLVSFGCGVDAITTDEVREILEREGKIYTQIKIDEITNLGAVKIRLRSLFSACEAKQRESGK
ncbi:MAG: 2-hydroxyglutaryl-CoA dehydratase [Clostridiales bacterium]|nr:2-hydroxyglutaryl-CoA dehydratase [Clostridiales bacterium]